MKKKRRTLIEELITRPHVFDFHQAIHILSKAFSSTKVQSENSNSTPILPIIEGIRFKSDIRLGAYNAPIHRLVRLREGAQPFLIWTRILSFAGTYGPFPFPYTERLLSNRKDKSLSNFLDIFHHRICLLWHKCYQKSSPALTMLKSIQHPLGRTLLNFAGFSGTSSRESPEVHYLLHLFPDLLWRQNVSIEALCVILSNLFTVKVDAIPFQEGIIICNPKEQTKIGVNTGRYNQLSRNFLLGRSSLDQAFGILVKLGPMPFERYEKLIPFIGTYYKHLESVCRYLLGYQITIAFHFILKKTEIRPIVLGDKHYLGFTTWLSFQHTPKEDSCFKTLLLSGFY